MKQFMRERISPIALTVIAPTIGFFLLFLSEIFLKTEVSRLWSSVINLVIVAPIAFLVFPKWLGIPFGRIEPRVHLRKLGFYFPPGAWKHIVLGVVLAACTLSGMLAASILSGEYTMDTSTITVTQLVFSLNPGLWEELFFRGVLMVLLLRFTRSYKWAFLIQVVLFGLMHIKGADLWSIVDIFSVMVLAVSYTFIVFKTRSLVAGIVFHYLHDAFIFFVQPSGDVSLSNADNAIFFGLLWLMVGVGFVFTWLAAEKLGVRAPEKLYSLEEG